MTSLEARRKFIEFFAARGHRVVPSSPLVLPNDPTLLFANAGMNQFKDVFTGRQRAEYRRATTVQRCLRVSGKHNDLEMVGRTPRHHTFFEMLGNFSFGDYFKADAIAFAWELITGEYGLPEDRLWVSVFGGSDVLEADGEARSIWRDSVGVRPDRIIELGESENFWRMGETGPCGPCSEIYYDLGPASATVEGESTPETDEGRYLEIWNLVFMQFDQQADGALVPLPAPSIDTGMGLERIVSVLQGKRTNYETDLFTPLLHAAAARAGTVYGKDDEADFSLRVIADHARAFCFLVADGVAPANDRRGYVLRRLLRRAIRHGRKLGLDEPFLQDVTPVVMDSLVPVYPELAAARDAVLDIGLREEQRFAETLSTGLEMLERQLGELAGSGETRVVLPGRDLFKLYDTFGFPLDLARDIAEERGIALDEAGFETEMAKQRDRAKASWKQGVREVVDAELQVLAERYPTRVESYDELSLEGTEVRALLRDGSPVETLGEGQEGQVVLEATPFYAESGGQVGDRGALSGADGRAEVLDTQHPVDGLVLHAVKVESGQLRVGEALLAEVDPQRRAAIRRNHTATHLLHAALREVVGIHVKQAGSLVAPDRLRFDFAHFAPVTERALADIESLINRKVLEDLPVESGVMELEEALGRGAMALFGEKYGQQVRVIEIGDFSLELCGGTHTARTGEIGLVKLTQERSVASGTRRMEAISGEGSLARFREDYGIARALEERFQTPRDHLLEELTRRLEETRELQKELERQKLVVLRARLAGRAERPHVVEGVKVLSERLDGVGPQELRELADSLRQKLGSGVVILGRAEAEKASLLVAVTDDLKGRIPAGELVRTLGKIIGGGGGGRPDLAEAGGKDPARLDEALQAALQAVAERVRSD